jgi:signal transduction histidine kinase
MMAMDKFSEKPPTVEALTAMLKERDLALNALERELEETNRGVVALYAELDVQAAQLREATEMKSRFLSYMSHEFRTPVAAIRSLSALLIDRVDGPLTEQQETQIRFIQKSANEFGEMIDDLLDLAKVEAGRVEIAVDWFEMVDLFTALRGMFKPMLTNPEVALIFEEVHDVPKLYSDNRKLSQILRNFISNALKFTSKGEVRCSAALTENETITFAVSDTGIGIAPEHHHAIFHDFAQIDSPVQKRLRGTGLGLSLSRRLAELLGGTVALQSELGKGSTFYVKLPLLWHPPQSQPSEELR